MKAPLTELPNFFHLIFETDRLSRRLDKMTRGAGVLPVPRVIRVTERRLLRLPDQLPLFCSSFISSSTAASS